ncbi:hypothetical protein KG892_02095 [Vermiphilus pyriformis]|nr:MAG: hypothetical protein KG892_02095 [Vermiphilus pyriformis]
MTRIHLLSLLTISLPICLGAQPIEVLASSKHHHHGHHNMVSTYDPRATLVWSATSAAIVSGIASYNTGSSDISLEGFAINTGLSAVINTLISYASGDKNFFSKIGGTIAGSALGHFIGKATR